MTLIALSGEAGAGKDTLADILVDRAGARKIKAKTIRFAQPIKEACYALGIDPDSREQKEVVQEYHLTYERLSEVVGAKFKYLTGPQRGEVASALYMKLVKGPRGTHGGFSFSPRQFQQWLGMGVRDVQIDYFIKHLLAESTALPDTLVVVPDCRFPNEVGIAHTSVYITRPDNPCRIESTDASESHLEVLAGMAEFIVRNYDDPCGEPWEDILEGQADFLLSQLADRGYLDECSDD